MNYIEPIKEALDENMHMECSIFMLIGIPRETPRYMNFGNYNLDTKVLRIQSTQTSGIFFDIETDYDYIECDVFWHQFKEYRTKFLKDNYPTINPN